MAATAKSWKVESGRWKTVWFPHKASTLISSGVLVTVNAGYVEEATTTAGQSDLPVLGIYEGPTVAAADATTALIAVQTPADAYCLARGLVDTGTPSATADLGKSFDISATNGVTFSTTTNEPVTFAKYISATEGLFVLCHLFGSPSA